jgi:general secretion pathway protein I
LLEVLVALAILAIAMAALVRGAGQNAANQNYIQERTFAHWVAKNRLAELQLQKNTPPVGRSEGVDMLGQTQWHWVLDVDKTADNNILRVRVEVSRESGRPVSAYIVGFTEVRP